MAAGLFINQRKVTAYGGPPSNTVHAGEYMTCSNGHKQASITRGFDAKRQDNYVEARCHAQGCPGIQRIYDEDRKKNTYEL